MTDADALFAQILENPADDAPRLVYADWLDERGQTERAEFIRCQIEGKRLEAVVDRWANTPSNQPGGTAEDGGPAGAALAQAQTLRRREQELLFDNWPRWLHQAFDDLSHDVGVSTRDASDFGVSLYDQRAGEQGHFDCRFRRGFVAEITLSYAAWREYGMKLRKAAPLERVTLTELPQQFSPTRILTFDISANRLPTPC